MVAGVGDDRVGGAEDRPQRADVGLVAGGEDDRVLGPLPVGDLLLELEVQRRRAVEQSRAGQARAVALERVARALDDALVAREPQVVVGAEHDARGPFHLDDRARRALDGAEVGDDVGLARGAQQGHPLVVAGLGKDVDRGLGHVGCAAVSVDVRPVEGRKELREFIELPYRLHSTSQYWIPPLRIERRLFLSRRQNAFFKHGDAQLFCAWRDGRVVGPHQRPDRPRLQRATRTTAGGCSASSSSRTTPRSCRRCSPAAEAWLRARGRDLMIGPMDFGINDESGVLVEGFDREPMIKQPWHPPYYAARCEQAGLEKAMDLWMWELDIADRVEDPADRLRARRAGRPQARRARSARCRAARCGATWTASPRSTTRPGRRTGASRRTPRRTSTTTPRRCSSSSTPPGSWSPRRTARRWRWRSRSRTSTRCCKKMNGRMLPFGWWHFLRRRKIIDRCPRRLPGRQTRVPAHWRGRRAVRRALRPRRA